MKAVRIFRNVIK